MVYSESGHMEKFVGKRNEKQIISEKGTPVRITANPDSVMHSSKVTLGVGGMVKLGEIQDPVLKEEEHFRREYHAMEENLFREARERVRQTHPLDADGEPAFGENGRVVEMVKHMLEADPARREALEQAKAMVETIKKRRYQFGKQDKHDLYVGKEGTLVYSILSGKRPANELKKAAVWKKNAHGISEPDPEWAVKIAALRERMSRAEHVADIHQVEVLPEYQGKGIAQALLDVALWDIEHNNPDVAFTIARVSSDNPDGPKMIAAFEKSGFSAFDAGQLAWDDPTDCTLVVRENPYYKQTS